MSADSDSYVEPERRLPQWLLIVLPSALAVGVYCVWWPESFRGAVAVLVGGLVAFAMLLALAIFPWLSQKIAPEFWDRRTALGELATRYATYLSGLPTPEGSPILFIVAGIGALANWCLIVLGLTDVLTMSTTGLPFSIPNAAAALVVATLLLSFEIAPGALSMRADRSRGQELALTIGCAGIELALVVGRMVSLGAKAGILETTILAACGAAAPFLIFHLGRESAGLLPPFVLRLMAKVTYARQRTTLTLMLTALLIAMTPGRLIVAILARLDRLLPPAAPPQGRQWSAPAAPTTQGVWSRS